MKSYTHLILFTVLGMYLMSFSCNKEEVTPTAPSPNPCEKTYDFELYPNTFLSTIPQYKYDTKSQKNIPLRKITKAVKTNNQQMHYIAVYSCAVNDESIALINVYNCNGNLVWEPETPNNFYHYQDQYYLMNFQVEHLSATKVWEVNTTVGCNISLSEDPCSPFWKGHYQNIGYTWLASAVEVSNPLHKIVHTNDSGTTTELHLRKVYRATNPQGNNNFYKFQYENYYQPNLLFHKVYSCNGNLVCESISSVSNPITNGYNTNALIWEHSRFIAN